MTTLTEPLAPWLRDLNRLFAQGGGAASTLMPPADVLVTEEEVTVYMDVPGVPSDNLDIELENDVLTVRGERPYPYDRGHDQGQGQGQIWRRIERSFGRFERDLRVPHGLDPNAVEAALAGGVLTLRIPKPEALKPHRIEIRTNGEGSGQREVQG